MRFATTDHRAVRRLLDMGRTLIAAIIFSVIAWIATLSLAYLAIPMIASIVLHIFSSI